MIFLVSQNDVWPLVTFSHLENGYNFKMVWTTRWFANGIWWKKVVMISDNICRFYTSKKCRKIRPTFKLASGEMMAPSPSTFVRCLCLAEILSGFCIIPCGPEGLMQVMTAQNPLRKGSDRNAYNMGLTHELL